MRIANVADAANEEFSCELGFSGCEVAVESEGSAQQVWAPGGASCRVEVALLHNVDNRSEAEKEKANMMPPKEIERFSVEPVVEGVAGDAAGATAAEAPVSGNSSATLATPTVAPVTVPTVGGRRRRTNSSVAGGGVGGGSQSEVRKCIRIYDLPTEWTAEDLKELCTQYGVVQNVAPDGVGRFLVTLHSSEAAEQAQRALDGLEVQNEVDFVFLRCELISRTVAKSHDPEVVWWPGEADGPPFEVYIDDLVLAVGEPEPTDREIYIRDMPLEDYTEAQLREWLDSFGKTERVVFCANPLTKELTGRGFVRFATHEDAGGLLAAFPVDDSDGNVQGSWSLSERLLQGERGHLRVDVCNALSARLSEIQAELPGCSFLVLAGDKQDCANAEMKFGPLRFAAWPYESLIRQRETLRARLSTLLTEAIEDPAAFSGMPLAPVRPAPSAFSVPGKTFSQGDDVSDGELSECSEEDPPPTSPCIVLRGFPPSWTQQQVRQVFALFGGIVSVRFMRDVGGRRSARIELKLPENMSKAVEQLHNTQVGDGEIIEECTVTCEILDVGGSRKPTVSVRQKRVLFVDELSMPKRPDVPPNDQDREVFLKHLPVKDCSMEQIQSWLEGFGTVEDVCLLHDARSRELSSRGYVRFASHREASACVEAQASAVNAEEGDVVAAWSESERALQGCASVYGADVHTAFAGSSGRVLASILVSAKMKELWMRGEKFPAKDRGVPQAEGKQLHFVTECDDGQFEELKKVLAGALANFHEKAAKRLKEPKEAKEKEPKETKDTKVKGAKRRSRSRLRSPASGKEMPEAKAPAVARSPWTGPPDVDKWQAMRHDPNSGGWFDWRSRQPPPPGWFPPERYGHPGYPPYPPTGPGGAYPGTGPLLGSGGIPPWGGCPADWRGPPLGFGHAPPPHGCAGNFPGPPPPCGPGGCSIGGSHPSSSTAAPPVPSYCSGGGSASSKGVARSPSEGGRRRHSERSAKVLPTSSKRDRSIGKHERGRRRDSTHGDSKESENQAALDPVLQHRINKGDGLVSEARCLAKKSPGKAYEKYCRGLQYLLDVMPKLEKDKQRAETLRLRINGYLTEAERTKERVESVCANEGGGGCGDAEADATSAPMPQPAFCAALDSQTGADISNGVGGSGESQGGSDGVPKGTKKSDTLLREGEVLEADGKLAEAYEKYCLGLQNMLDFVDPDVHTHKTKMTTYFEKAERLKEIIESEEAGKNPCIGPVRVLAGCNGNTSPRVACPREEQSRSRSRRHRGRRRHSHRSSRAGGDGIGATLSAASAPPGSAGNVISSLHTGDRTERRGRRGTRSERRRQEAGRDCDRDRGGEPAGDKSGRGQSDVGGFGVGGSHSGNANLLPAPRLTGGNQVSVPATRVKGRAPSPPVTLRANECYPGGKTWAGAASKAAPSARR
eukprot:TRINITY_DN25611_c0_g1_i3.p1 TRINITY_DN25611_c0_g1~~TRINITY_DN25611_c0_g1_i3.p1  ORF type:complete len:1415 (-),score=328.77 TRINITY_DN25611_c0_g1_i3:116-4360(-)